MAYEGDFIELLVANERISNWVDRIKKSKQESSQKIAILDLQKSVTSKVAYAEEAQRLGVVNILTRVLGLSGCHPLSPALAVDEEVLDAASSIIAACSGPLASGGKENKYQYEHLRIRIREGALGDGLGAKVWLMAHVLCRELVRHPALVAGQRVLEVGSGCGLCGIVAARLNPAEAVLTDYELPVLRNLRSCMHLNLEAATPAADHVVVRADAASGGGGDEAGMESEDGLAGVPTDAELFDDAEEVDDFDLREMMLDGCRAQVLAKNETNIVVDNEAESASPAAKSRVSCASQKEEGSPAASWSCGGTSVKFLDWGQSLARLDGQPEPARREEFRGETDVPDQVDEEAQFPVIVGSEVIYEPNHARMLAAVIRHRLAPAGKCLLSCAVREQKVFDLFRRECVRRGLRYREHRVEPEREYEGLLGQAESYEGGFLLMAVDHRDTPCLSWHREDFVEKALN